MRCLAGSDMCPFGSWPSLRCGGFLTAIMSSASSHRLYAIRRFVIGSSICPVEIWSSLTLRRISLGHYALRLILYAIGYAPCAVLMGFGSRPVDVWSSLRCGGHLEGILPFANLPLTNLYSLISNV